MVSNSMIYDVVATFKGRNGEPSTPAETYILKSMWVMMMSEFEAAFKEIVERHIDIVKTLDVADIHVCLLIQAFKGPKSKELTPQRIVSFYKKPASEISYNNFTKDRKPKYKPEAVEELLNNLGVFLSDAERSELKVLAGCASTRDSIAHGDTNISITRTELEQQLIALRKVLELIAGRLHPVTRAVLKAPPPL